MVILNATGFIYSVLVIHNAVTVSILELWSFSLIKGIIFKLWPFNSIMSSHLQAIGFVLVIFNVIGLNS